MKKTGPSSEDRSRQHARRAGPRRPAAEARAGGAGDVGRLVHELQVRQVELDLQDEEIRSSRDEAEAALARFAALFELAPIGYLAVTPAGIVRQANLAAARLLARGRDELLGVRLEAFVAPGQERRLRRFLAGVLDQPGPAGATTDCELTLVPRGPSRVEVQVTAGALADAEPLVLLALQDVTVRRRAEAALREASERKDAFLATLSHELRNPLEPIRNALHLLAHAVPGSEQAHRSTEIIARQVGHLTRIVEDLLEVTRLARGKLRLARERVELAALVGRTVEDHRPAFERRGLALACALAPGPCWVDGDPTRLAQVLGNLLGNAGKFTASGGHVQVRLAREPGFALLSVRDDGVGIDPALRAHLFEPFSQAPQTLDRSGGGLGLGLATVKGLVELHGGSVRIASPQGGAGTEVVIRLALAGGPAEPAPAPGGRPAAPHRVLVIDDNADGANSLKDVLELSGHDVHVALDGPGGLVEAAGFQPDVVICDIGLPGMDGYEVARALRSASAHRPFLIALSGYALPEDLRRAEQAGFDRHVAKPPALERLEAMLGEAPSWEAARAEAQARP